MTTIKACTCSSPTQDKLHGKGLRVMNSTGKKRQMQGTLVALHRLQP